MDTIMKDLADKDSDETSKQVELFSEIVLLKSKLKSSEALVKEREQKTLEVETSLIDANTEMEKLKDVSNKFEEEIKLKNEQNELLIGEQNKLEENLVRNNGILQKMFQERTAMNNVIEKQKTTIELIKQGSNSEVTEGGDGELKQNLLQR